MEQDLFRFVGRTGHRKFLRRDGNGFSQTANQSLAIKLGDIVVETRFAAAFEIIVGCLSGQCHYGNVAPPGIASNVDGEFEPIHFRHFDIADDDIEFAAEFTQFQRFGGGFGGGHFPTGDRQQRRE